MKLGYIQSEPKQRTTPFHSGDLVQDEDLGNGVVVGFSSISGEPHVFFYSCQQVVCVSADEIEHA